MSFLTILGVTRNPPDSMRVKCFDYSDEINKRIIGVTIAAREATAGRPLPGRNRMGLPCRER